jgi:methionyl-tRNA formyltransferase
MFNTIILLAETSEQGMLATLLRQHNPKLAVRAVASIEEIDALKPDRLARARLVGFVTPVVVPKRILDALGFGAYNFHPGPPQYPGWMPAHFAIYDRATEFGATAHVMIERVDAGPIVGVEYFPVPQQAGVLKLEQLAYVQIAQMFWNLAPILANQTEPISELSVQWSGRKGTRRLHAALCDMAPDISEDELDRRIEAFGAGHSGVSPTITMYGRRFRYAESEAVMGPRPTLVMPVRPAAQTAPQRRRA